MSIVVDLLIFFVFVLSIKSNLAETNKPWLSCCRQNSFSYSLKGNWQSLYENINQSLVGEWRRTAVRRRHSKTLIAGHKIHVCRFCQSAQPQGRRNLYGVPGELIAPKVSKWFSISSASSRPLPPRTMC